MRMKENITIDETIDFLNKLLEIDRKALSNIITNRVECNDDLVNHKTVQVAKLDNVYKVGMLGILNGLFGTDERGYGAIGILVLGNEIQEFVKIKGEDYE